MVPLLLVGLLTSSLARAPYVVFVELVPAPGSAPALRLSGFMERELQRLGADDIDLIADASSEDERARGCGAAMLTARFQASRGDLSAFLRSIPVLSEQSGAPICGMAYRQELGVRSLRTIAVASGMPIVALVLAVLLLRGPNASHRSLIGILPDVGPAVRLGTMTGVLCLVLPLMLVQATARSDLAIDTVGDVRIAGLQEVMWLGLLVVLCAPLVEEYAFRSRFLDAARKAVGPDLALILSATAFAVFHLPGTMATFSMYWVLGVVLGVLWLRSRSLLACFTAHATYNAAVFVWTIPALT